MAYGIVHHFPGGTKEQYEASLAAVHPSDGSLPEGQVFHAAGPSGDGWTRKGGARGSRPRGANPATRPADRAARAETTTGSDILGVAVTGSDK